jgi:tetratricopeptide (TPR) repeat protein
MMAQVPVKKNVQGGVPWWIWLIITALGGVLLLVAITQLTPDDPMAHFDKAIAAYNAQNAEELLEEIERFDRFEGYESEKRLLLGMKWIAQARPLKAIPVLKEAAADQKTRARALPQLGRAYQRSGQYKDAMDILETAVAEDPNALESLAVLVRLYHDMGAMQKTIATADVLIENGDHLQAAYRARGEVQQRLGNYEEAAADLEAAIEADPQNLQTPAIALPMLACFIKSGGYERAASYLEMADSGPSRELLQAQIHLGIDEAVEAFEVLQPVLTDLAGQPAAFVTLGRAVVAAKHEAVNETLDVIRRDLPYMSRDGELYDVLSELSVLAGDEGAAELYRRNRDKLREMKSAYLQRIADGPPSFDDAQWFLETGDLAAELRDFESARYWYNATVRIDRDRTGDATARLDLLYSPRPELVPTLPKGETPTATEDGSASTTDDAGSDASDPGKASPEPDPNLGNPNPSASAK